MKNNEHKVRVDNSFAILEYSYGENKLNGSFKIYEKDPLDIEKLFMIIGTYKEGELNGICELYYGIEKVKMCHYQNGKLNGVCEEYDDGKVLERYFYKDGILDGDYEIYDIYGNLEIKFNYVNGFSDGLYTSYDENGEILSEGIFSEIESIITEKEFYSNGNLEEVKMKYSSGPYEKYYSNGKLKMRGTLNSGGELHNSYEEYYETGNLKMKCEYKTRKLNGEYTEYYETGEIKVKCNYENGEKVGLYREYDITGKVIKEEFYEFSNRKLFSDGHFAVKLLSSELRAVPREMATRSLKILKKTYSKLATLRMDI